MIDSWMVRQIQPTLNQFALDWVPKWLRANAVTVMGFLVGLLVLPLLRDQSYLLALIVILFNRFLDGLDGAIARRDGVSDFGGFLDMPFSKHLKGHLAPVLSIFAVASGCAFHGI